MKIKTPNGLDCSGFVSWALLNGGYDVGDVGAGINEDRTDDLDDLSTKMKLTEENFDASLVKPGDLIGRYGHIGIIIGKEDSTFYIAESLDYDLHVLTMTRDEIILNLQKYFRFPALKCTIGFRNKNMLSVRCRSESRSCRERRGQQAFRRGYGFRKDFPFRRGQGQKRQGEDISSEFQDFPFG